MITAFIPARSGSKSIPNKNIKELGGKPLISWTIETALMCGLDRVILNTDSEEYAKIAKQFGAEAMLRPEELAQDNTSMFEVLKSEVPKIEPLPEVVVLMQPTSPFRKKARVKAAIASFVKNIDQYDSLISAEKVPEKYNPAQVIVNTPMGLRMATGAPIPQRQTMRQNFPTAWIPDGDLYIFKTSNLENGSIYGDKSIILESEGALNINTPEEWAEAESRVAVKPKVVSSKSVMHIAEGGICESCE